MNWRLTAFGGGICIALLAAAIGFYQSTTPSPPAPPAVASSSAAQKDEEVKPAESSGLQPFNGVWEFKLTGGANCPVKSNTFRRRFKGNVVMMAGQNIGTVDSDGRFRFSYPSPANPNVTIASQGRVDGDTGNGTYDVLGTRCQGTYQIRLVERM